MSVNPVSTPAIPQSHPLDEFGKNVVDTGAVPFTLLRDGIKEFTKAITPEEHVHKKFDNETPAISALAHRVLEFYINWFKNVLINSREYALNAERFVEKIVKWPLTPITYFDTGVAFQKFICETIIGTTVFVIVYVALQIFHVVPYITSTVILTGAYVFYQTAPVAMITLLAASILLLNVYVGYYAAGEMRAVGNTIDAGKNTLDKGFDSALNKIGEIEKEVGELKADVRDTALPLIKIAAYSLIAASTISTTVICSVAYYVLVNRTI